MGLVGYVDRDRTLNDTMNYEWASSYGISYARVEKISNATPIQGPKKINALYRDWGFPGGDIVQIKKRIHALLDSFSKEIFIYPVGRIEDNIIHCRQCYNELMKCVAKENGLKEIIPLERFDIVFFTSIYWQYVEKEISKKKACSFVEHYLSCRVRGMKLLDEKDKEILLLVEKIHQLEEKHKEIQLKNQRSEELKNAFIDAVDLNNLHYEKFVASIDAEICQGKQKMLAIKENIEKMMEQQNAIEEVTQLLLYGTRDVEKDLKQVQKKINR